MRRGSSTTRARNAPEKWDDGLGTGRSHILVMLNGSKGNAGPFADAVASVIKRAELHGLALAHRQDAAALVNRREHFG